MPNQLSLPFFYYLPIPNRCSATQSCKLQRSEDTASAPVTHQHKFDKSHEYLLSQASLLFKFGNTAYITVKNTQGYKRLRGKIGSPYEA